MKKNILILISAALISTAASVATNTVISKPALPKIVIHVVLNTSEDVIKYVDYCVKNGFVIKTIATMGGRAANYHGSDDYIIIAEKY